MLEQDQMLASNVVKWVTSSEDCQYDGDKPSSDKQPLKQTPADAYDPVVGKWMPNLVATTPVTAKAMQSLLLELHRQKELKRAYQMTL